MNKLKKYEWIILILIIPWIWLIVNLIQNGYWFIAVPVLLLPIIALFAIFDFINTIIKEIKDFFSIGKPKP